MNSNQNNTLRTHDDRPYVICHMQCSIDGRISGQFFFTPEADAAYERDNEIRNSYDADAIMNGAVTCAEIYADGFLARRLDGAGAEYTPNDGAERKDFLAESHFGRFVICVDPKGTLKWSRNQVSHRGGPQAHVVEVLTEDVDDSYLTYLRDLNISYIFAGETELDLPLALGKLRSLLGIERILLTGGGLMNRTFLEAGCIDELNLVILPFLDGNTDSALLFDGPGTAGTPSGKANGAFAPAGFKLAQVETLPGGAVRLKYVL